MCVCVYMCIVYVLTHRHTLAPTTYKIYTVDDDAARGVVVKREKQKKKMEGNLVEENLRFCLDRLVLSR